MPAEWRTAPNFIIDIAKRLIKEHYPDLLEARIAFIMRSEASKSNGMETIGKAKKVSAELQLHIPFDFVIWLASDAFGRLSPNQREVLIEHQLCHLQWIDGVAKIRGHDFDGDFIKIVKRHGLLWWPQSDALAIAIQQSLPLTPSPDEPRREGNVGTIDFGRIAREVAEGMREHDFGDGVETEFRVAASREDE